MPGGDRTGPWGAGPRTGRGMGFCAGYNMPGYMNFFGGRGFGFGRGGGRGNRWGFYATGLPGWARGGAPYWGAPFYGGYNAPQAISEKDELRYLREQAKYVGEMLEEINARINEIAKADEKARSK